MTAPKPPESPLFVVAPPKDGEPLVAAIERALERRESPLDQLPTLTNVALGDPYLAEQLASLHHGWELRPPPARGLLARLRARLAWWLLGPELAQASATHATLVRLIDSLVVQLDQERSARRRIEDHLATSSELRVES
jgi:hypothetical protein